MAMPPPDRGLPALSVGITTRNRPVSLVRCLASLEVLGDLVTDIIVVDDSSDRPVGPVLADLPAMLSNKLTLISQPGRQGYIVARNTMVRLAKSDCVMLLDDDACLMDEGGVRRALALMVGNPEVGAVAFAMAEVGGRPWPAAMQPSPATCISYVAAYIGFAHLLRRRLFLELGGYRESFRFYGEEKDYCSSAAERGLRRGVRPRCPRGAHRRSGGTQRGSISSLREPERLPALTLQRTAAAATRDRAVAPGAVCEDASSRSCSRSRRARLGRARAPCRAPRSPSRAQARDVGQRETLAMASPGFAGVWSGAGCLMARQPPCLFVNSGILGMQSFSKYIREAMALVIAAG